MILLCSTRVHECVLGVVRRICVCKLALPIRYNCMLPMYNLTSTEAHACNLLPFVYATTDGQSTICIHYARLSYAVRLCSSQDDCGMQAYIHGKLRSLTKAPMLTLHVVGLGAFVHAVAETAVSETGRRASCGTKRHCLWQVIT